MKIRVRIGVRLSNPFGLFNNAATFVVYAKDQAGYASLVEKVGFLKEVLYAQNDPKARELADRLFVERG